MSKGTGEYSDFNGRHGHVSGPNGRIAGPYALDAITEMRMHSENVHHPDSKAERDRRERAKVYAAAKAELAAKRAASAPPDRLPS
jgi:hypothetical protein